MYCYKLKCVFCDNTFWLDKAYILHEEKFDHKVNLE